MRHINLRQLDLLVRRKKTIGQNRNEKHLKMLLGRLLSLIFLGCSSVKIYDEPWCFDAGKYGAECFYTLSDREFTLDKYQWDKLRLGQACSANNEPALGFSRLKTALEKLCADTNRCTPEQVEQIKSFNKRYESAQQKALQ